MRACEEARQGRRREGELTPMAWVEKLRELPQLRWNGGMGWE
jgi:hypothetical protein